MLRNLSAKSSTKTNTVESATNFNVNLSSGTTQIEYIVETNNFEDERLAQKSRDLKEFEAQARLTKSTATRNENNLSSSLYSSNDLGN